MLVMAPSKSLQKLDLINTIQRFCVDYHFAHEIEESLSYMYTHYEEWISEVDGNDLHAIALCFRLLRQQGYYVSCDAFRKFTDNQGNFKKELVNDVHGMLSLYEAAQYRVHDEEILDEALNFTITQLKLILPKLSNSHLAQQVSNALKFSIKDGVVKVETKKYISFYQENHESCNQVLLNFAKLDFNILQRLHKKKLLVKALPYVRDRLAELYFWSLGCYYELHYSFGRKIITKFLFFTSIIDDIYGTIDELTLFAEAIERWNIDASEQLPSYMKIIYRGLVDVFNEVEKELASENKSFLIDYCITEMKKVSRAYFQEAKWYHEKKVPALKQYIKNGIPSSGCQLFATACCVGLGKVATKDALDWLASEPPILDALCNIGRLLNDFTSHEDKVISGFFLKVIRTFFTSTPQQILHPINTPI
ncbi:putative embryonic protein DC-8-like isoform X1 [Capsicum annuum]|nr:putative embryonic protein DC-8-like isoform X1 [Capsicum annuum]